MWHYGIIQSQHYNYDNNYNDDNALYVSMWFELFDDLF